MKKIFIAGHRGMVGSAIYRSISKKNKIIVEEKKNLNLLSFEKTYNFFKKHKFDHVYICAAKVGGILANSKYPYDFLICVKLFISFIGSEFKKCGTLSPCTYFISKKYFSSIFPEFRTGGTEIPESRQQ